MQMKPGRGRAGGPAGYSGGRPPRPLLEQGWAPPPPPPHMMRGMGSRPRPPPPPPFGAPMRSRGAPRGRGLPPGGGRGGPSGRGRGGPSGRGRGAAAAAAASPSGRGFSSSRSRGATRGRGRPSRTSGLSGPNRNTKGEKVSARCPLAGLLRTDACSACPRSAAAAHCFGRCRFPVPFAVPVSVRRRASCRPAGLAVLRHITVTSVPCC